MMPAAGAPPAGFYMASITLALVTGIIFAYMYTVLRQSVCGKSVKERGICYGLILFFIATLPGMAALYLLINLPLALVLVWVLEGLFVNVIGAMGIVKVVD